jgi:hypothetical protein
MDALVQTILGELPESVTGSKLLELVPRLVKEADAFTVPGAEKKDAVLKALKSLIQFLKEQGKIQEELAVELSAFIDTSVATTINLLMDVAKGRVELRMPRTVEEVGKQVNCCMGFLSGIVGIVTKKAKAAAAPAAAAPAAAVAVAVAAAAEVPNVTVTPQVA